ncbi:hypothetical protein BCR42DRAFT_407198 [Absidia repens]|uniref:Uncharacterized protein n=1 Tax=Absidia repens TaxID=90262 RepID=A0A1X2IRZ3_9FUNG|nr:hypothetical protein BCR42DRAFT_407198 [Absidia repens]
MLLQFLSDWKIDRRPSNKHQANHRSKTNRPSSIISTETLPNSDSIDWHDCKQTWSFKTDYVSFPSLEYDDSQDDEARLHNML